MSAEIAKHIDAMKGLIAALDPKGKIKATRTEALEWWDRARTAANNRDDREDGRMNRYEQ